MTLSFVLLALAAGAAPSSSSLQLPNGESVEITADYFEYGPSSEKLLLKGHPVVRTRDGTLRADEIQLDSQTGHALAKGNALLVSGLTTALADEISVDLATLDAEVKGGLLMQKQGVSEESLAAIATPEGLRAAGRTVLTLTGERVRRLGPNELQVDRVSFTPCDCNALEPSWRITASSGNVRMGDRATLTWPVVYVGKVPVFALPYLYLPLSDRKSGLLITRPAFSSKSGFTLDQPIFLTLGRSYDVTLTPGYAFGLSEPDPGRPLRFGVRGPRLHTEFRYVPSETTRGRATLGLLYDLRPQRDPVSQASLPGTRRGLRGDASWTHDQDLGAGFFDRVDAYAMSDGFYWQDVTTDAVAQQLGYLRSTAVLGHRSEDTYVGADVNLRQDLQWGYSLFGGDVAGGSVPQGPRTLQKLPGLLFALPARPLWGPLSASVRAEFSRLAPWRGGFSDEGVDGLFALPTAEPSQGNGVFEPGEREARDRLDLFPRLAVAFGGAAVRTTLSAGYRQSLAVGELSGDVSHRGYPLLGLLVDSELSRVFTSVRHAITPSLELRSAPVVVGDAPPLVYDELDRAIGSGRFLQLRAAVDQRVWRKSGDSVVELARLELSQTADLLGNRLGESRAWLGLGLGPVQLSALASYDLTRQQLTQIASRGELRFNATDGLYAEYQYLSLTGTERMAAGLDELLGQALPSSWREGEQSVQVGGFVGFRAGLALRGNVDIFPEPPTPAEDYWKASLISLGVSYAPACDCWRVEGYAVVRPPTNLVPEFGLNLVLSKFGSFGTGG